MEIARIKKGKTLEAGDQETGEVMTFTQEDSDRLTYLEQGMALNYLQIAYSIKEIRDRRLFFLRDCSSMKDYAEQCLKMSERNVKNYLQIADAFHESSVKKLDSTPSMRTLIELSRDQALWDSINDGDASMTATWWSTPTAERSP
jgi:hypothetical protein